MNNHSKYQKFLPEVFADIKANPVELISFSDQSMALKVKLSKTEQPLTFELPLVMSKLAPSDSIFYIK